MADLKVAPRVPVTELQDAPPSIHLITGEHPDFCFADPAAHGEETSVDAFDRGRQAKSSDLGAIAFTVQLGFGFSQPTFFGQASQARFIASCGFG